MLVHVIHALIQLNSWEAIRGMGIWLKDLVGTTPLWITAAESHAKGSYETACTDYRKSLEMISTGRDADAPIVEFVINRVSWCLHVRCQSLHIQ